jgi:voltage-gated potassium channel
MLAKLSLVTMEPDQLIRTRFDQLRRTSMIFNWWQKFLRGNRERRWKVRTEQKLGRSLGKTGGYLLIIFIAHTAAMVFFEGMSAGDGLWLTLTTVTTVGYGDVSATSFAGRLATVLLLYAGGIFVLAKIAGDYFEFRSERRERMARGQWEWEMQDHILIINTPDEDPEEYFERLIGQFRASAMFADTPVQILTTYFGDGLPPSLAAMGNVVHYHGSGSNTAALEAVGVNNAKAIVLLSESEHNATFDGVTFDTLHRLRELGTTAPVLAECLRDENRARFKQAGANLVIRPMRAYPGMVVRGFVAPGVEQVFEELFRSDGGEYRRFDVTIDGTRWADVVATLIQLNLGVAVAYEGAADGEIHITPGAEQSIKASALFVLAGDDNASHAEHISSALAAV